MSYKYFGMTTDAWMRKHPEPKRDAPRPQDAHPLTFITVDKPSENVSPEGSYLMVVRAATASGKDVIPPLYVARDKRSLTQHLSEAVRVSLGWKYDRQTNWREVAANAIRLMAELAKQQGVPSNSIKEWYE